jgi:hypothetical protein
MPQEVIVRVDGQTVFQASNDSLAFSQNRQMSLEWLELPGVREKWLYKRPGNTLPGRRGEPWSRRTDNLPSGRHRVEVITRDHAGNLARVSWQLEVLAPAAAWTAREEMGRRQQEAPDVEQPPAPSAQDARAEVEPLQWQEDPVRVPLPPLPSGTRRWLTPFLVVEEDTTTGVQAAHLVANYAGRPGDHFLLVQSDDPADQGTLLWVVPDSLPPSEIAVAQAEQGLAYLGTVVRVQAVDRHNWRLPVVEVPVGKVRPDSGMVVGVYRQGRNATWGHVETPLQTAQTDSGLVWRVPVPAPGRLALFQDVQPPQIGWDGKDRLVVRPQAAESVAGVTLSRWQTIAIKVFDAGAGIDPTSLRTWLDGRLFVFEPDLLRNRILVELPDDLDVGSHELIILASDFAGNSSLRNLTLDCRAAP